jgi:hypothetical protein
MNGAGQDRRSGCAPTAIMGLGFVLLLPGACFLDFSGLWGWTPGVVILGTGIVMIIVAFIRLIMEERNRMRGSGQ